MTKMTLSLGVIFFFLNPLVLVLGGQTQAANPAPTQPAVLVAPADVAAPPSDAQRLPSGVAFKVLAPGHGNDHPAQNDCIRTSFVGWRRSGKVFSTSGIHHESMLQCMNTAIPGVAVVLKGMTTGEKCRIWVPAALTFHEGHQHSKEEDRELPNADLTFDVELLQIIKAPPTPVDLKAPPKNATRLPSGVAFQVLKSGSGQSHPSMTSQVLLQFSCWTSDGKLFESTELSGHPAMFQLSTLMPGWRDGVAQMVVGERARFWVPAALAYGDKPVSHMSPAGNLIYETELLKIQ